MSETPDPGAAVAAPDSDVKVTVQMGQGLPWWIPETRLLVAVALFGLAWRILDLIASNPTLSKDTLFVTIATSIFGGGGVLAITGFYYMASKKDRQAQSQGGPTLPAE